MASGMDLPKRSDVKRRIDDDKERMVTKEHAMEEGADDIGTARDTLGALELDTTEEGALSVSDEIENAEREAHDFFDEREVELEEVHSESEEHGDELDTREASGESDLKRIESSDDALHLDATLDRFAKALESLTEDVEFLRDEAERNRVLREQSDLRRDALRARAEQKG